MRKVSQLDHSESAVSFDEWTGGRSIESIGTNAGAEALPFQDWRHFKEAFAPELIKRAIEESPIPVRHCLDPFGGSGTSALACQFLGVRPTTIEVNPYLADLIQAKLTKYDPNSLAPDFARWVRAANRLRVSPREFFAQAPSTFVEPGVDQRWIFNKPVAARVAAYVASLPSVKNEDNRRLFKVLLGGVLVSVSNVFINGKGRRYRRNWEARSVSSRDVDEALCSSVERAVGDILRHGQRLEYRHRVVRGDARQLIKSIRNIDLAVFSPPYPNSFDYTDVYNVELWGLRYLESTSDNRALRTSTLSSHVQINRTYTVAPTQSALLNKTVRALRAREEDLWNRNIPEMIGAYFADMMETLKAIKARLPVKGQVWIVVGDSRYAGVSIPVARILAQLAPALGCEVVAKEPFRSMRTSAQQGGELGLDETLIILGRR